MTDPAVLLRRGRVLEVTTLAWNVVGVAVLGVGAIMSRSVALAGFGLDSLIEIGASVVVLWELADSDAGRQRRALVLIAGAFVALAGYLTVQAAASLLLEVRPHHSPVGVLWTAVTAGVMFGLATGKRRVGQRLDNRVLLTEARVTLIDGVLASAVLVGLLLNAALGWWWADPLTGLVIVVYAVREVLAIRADLHA